MSTTVTIYVRLMNGGAEAWRPVQAMLEREDIYVLMGPVAEGEEWQFQPGTLVRRKPKTMSNGRQEMVAVAV